MTTETNTPATLADDALDQAQGGAAYMKIRGIEGDFSAKTGDESTSGRDTKSTAGHGRIAGGAGNDEFFLG